MTGPLLVAIAVSFAVRAIGLDSQSFWWDEAYSAVIARGSLATIVGTVASEDFHPPGHYVLLKAWAMFAGESEFALRLLSVFFGTGTVAATAYLARRWFGPKAGLLAAVLSGASPFLWYYSTEARMFAAAGFIAVAIVAFGDRAATEKRWIPWIAWALAITAGLYTYYYLAPIAAASMLLLVVRRAPLRNLLGALALLGLLLAPWASVLVQRIVAWSNPWTEPTTPIRVLKWTWPALFTGLSDISLWNSNRIALGLVGVPIGIALVFLVMSRDNGRRSALGTLAGAHALWALPLLLMAGIAIIRPVFHPRYAFPVAPLLLVAVAGTLAIGGRRTILPRALLTAAISTLFAHGAARYYDGGGLGRDDYRNAVAAIDAAERPGDIIVTNSPPGVDYYHRGPAVRLELPTEPYRESSIVGALARGASGATRVWHQTHDLRPSDPENLLSAHLESTGDLNLSQDFGQLKLRAFGLAPGTTFHAFPRLDLRGIRFGTSATARSWASPPRATPSGETVFALVEVLVGDVGPELGAWAQIVDDAGRRWGRADHQPRDSGFRRSTHWRGGDTVEIGHAIPTVPGTPPGTYRVEAALYRLEDLSALEVFTAEGRPVGRSLVLGQIEVTRQRRPVIEPSIGETNVLAGLSLREIVMPDQPVAAGGSLGIELLWRTKGALPRLTGQISLTDGLGREVQSLSIPLGGRFTSDTWRTGDLVRDQIAMPVPPTLVNGEYRVSLRLTGREGLSSSAIALGVARIEGVSRTFEPPPIGTSLPTSFGDGVSLAGYGVSRVAEGVALTLIWRPSETPARRYKVFVHALAPDGSIASQHDGEPADWERPTTGWLAGEYISDRHTVAVPSGSFVDRLRVGIYDTETGVRRATGVGDDHVVIPLPGPAN